MLKVVVTKREIICMHKISASQPELPQTGWGSKGCLGIDFSKRCCLSIIISYDVGCKGSGAISLHGFSSLSLSAPLHDISVKSVAYHIV